MKKLKLLVCLFCLTQLAACQSTEDATAEKTLVLAPFPELDNSAFEFKPVPLANDLFVLSLEQKADFRKYFQSIKNENVPHHERLSNYLNDKLHKFNFRGKTLTASQTLVEGSGNCLSLAILATALAETVNLTTSHQTMHSEPIYHRHDNILKTSGHVRTFVYSKTRKHKTIRYESAVIDYFPDIDDVVGEIVTVQDFISMYYQNLAGEAIIAKDYNLAFSYLQEALKQNQYNPNTLNTLAVLNNQVGHDENTKKLYEFAINNTEKTHNLVSNYANYLEKHGQADKAKSLLAEVSNDDTNPYDWLDLANRHLKDGNLRLASKSYEKALELGPYLHEVHFGLAQLYWTQGQVTQALASLERAQSLTFEDPTKRLYIAKAMTLKKSIE
jgi:tetratricopeptide (TPR) repeat protein